MFQNDLPIDLELQDGEFAGVNTPATRAYWDLRDENERLQAELAEIQERLATLEHERRHDLLCPDLLNRYGFDEAIATVNARVEAGDTADYWLGVLDLDRFKDVNDTYGHHFGDKVLQAVGAYLGDDPGVIGPRGCLARLGGDEFAFLIDEPTLARLYDDALVITVEPECTIHGTPATGPIAVTMSIGVAAYDPAVKPERIKHAADAAMYEAKQITGISSIAVSPSLDGIAVEPRPLRRLRDERTATR